RAKEKGVRFLEIEVEDLESLCWILEYTGHLKPARLHWEDHPDLAITRALTKYIAATLDRVRLLGKPPMTREETIGKERQEWLERVKRRDAARSAKLKKPDK